MSEQGTQAWLQERCGKVTASRIADVMAKTKSGWGASRANYKAELVAERLTGVPAEGFVSKEMQWGTDHEEQARTAYQFYTDNLVQTTGFVPHPSIPMTGASPDGLVGRDGLIEMKCPNTATHIESLLDPIPAGKYVLQMQWQMACTGRLWCDFCSFDPRMPEEMRLLIVRISRDQTQINTLEREVRTFLTEIDNTVQALRSKFQLTETLRKAAE